MNLQAKFERVLENLEWVEEAASFNYQLYCNTRMREQKLESLVLELVDALNKIQGAAIVAPLAADPAEGVEILIEQVSRATPVLFKAREVLGDE